ncbi:glycosyl transferase family protein [Sphingomonas sp. NSE70-1]|uniref:Glycosyl transferase family protein n=1 Tax=Sphingomonas caseinilyticus TaxID=2908205 RepID=A0ABT0RVG5_9SPHN|nr:glycosyl transferase family protein [Sphingomonas caseinilyticus]MCL6698901.1 glycosyl transferase family protein [Sphingomonas caseinilyticus]
MSLFSFLLIEICAELSLFAAVGFLILSIDDLIVDLIYFARKAWRSAVIYSRFPRMFADRLPTPLRPGWLAVLVPAWDEASVIAPMLRASLQRFEHDDYTIFVGHYRNDPGTRAAIQSVADPRVVAVEVNADGPTTKADCLNHLFAALQVREEAIGRSAKAVVLHDAEDVVHPLELKLFDRLIEYAALVQLPVVPLIDRSSRWVAGHYADEFAESHVKELVVREAVGAAIPLAGVGCAIGRVALERLALRHDGRPFDGASMTEDYELGLRLGGIGLKTMFVRMLESPGSRAVVASRGHFPATVDAAVRQKARWIGGIAFSGWDRLGWNGGLGERWMRMRDRKGPLAAMLLLASYVAAALWAQIAFAAALGAPVAVPSSPVLGTLMMINAMILAWRLVMRASCTALVHGWREGLRSVPRAVVANVIAILATHRALMIHSAGGPRRWEKTHHIYPAKVVSS